MTVYADLAFSVNAVINYLLLLAGARLGGSTIRRKRFLLAAVFGGLYAAAALFPQLGFLKGGMMRAISLSAMLLIAFGWDERFMKRAGFFLEACFFFAGFVLCAVHLAGVGLLVFPGGAYYPVSFTALLLLAALGYLIVRLAGLSRRTGKKIIPLTLWCREKSVTLRALYDTGNTLTDPMTGSGVIVADWSAAAKLLPMELRQEDFQDPVQLVNRIHRTLPDVSPRLICYRAVGVDGGLLPAIRLQTEQAGVISIRLVAFSPVSISDGSVEALTGGDH